MTRLSVICERFDVVVVPFPFSEKAGTKRRPALLISNSEFNTAGNSVLAMITTKGHHPWPGDQPISDHENSGLPLPCIIRLKLFTLDNRLILRRLGKLGPIDKKKIQATLTKYLR